MTSPSFIDFWNDNKAKIGEALPKGIDALADVMAPGANALRYSQRVQGETVCWDTKEGEARMAFHRIPDPRDLNALLEAYVGAKARLPALTAILVRQWTDGEGMWDIFPIGPQRSMMHGGRISGSSEVEDKGPQLRQDIYRLFHCEEGFPEPGEAEWAKLLLGPFGKIHDQLALLAKERGYSQRVEDGTVQWIGPDEKIEAMFHFLTDLAKIDECIQIYRQIQETGCPITFVFVRENNRLHNIFRLSGRSYLEHHNQLKAAVDRKTPTVQPSGKLVVLDGLRWIPRFVSHLGCIQGCLNYLKIEVSDAWLYGATGHAFLLNIVGDLCPSGPTDWDTRRFLELGQNLGYQVECMVDDYCPEHKGDLERAQTSAWNSVRNAIDAGLPCYGWELRLPEYYVIYGYDDAGYYVSGAGREEYGGPVSWKTLGTSEIGVVLVCSVKKTDPAEDTKTVHDALDYAVQLGKREKFFARGTSTLDHYKNWIRSMESGGAAEFGLAYNTAVWSECRRHAVEFLQEAKARLNRDFGSLFDEAIGHYGIVSENLEALTKLYPFSGDLEMNPIGINEKSKKATQLVKNARTAESAALEVLEELVTQLSD